ncbi:MAG TPA: TM2 domain-containing protein [Phycisphaerales bacterium]|nr:TM2 domain-containing protein [Phycisphaerales bacterium]
MPKCSRVVYILLAFFLGGLGIHNFVAGYTVRGVVQLVLSLVCAVMVFCTFGLSAVGLLAVFVWTIVEIVVVDKDVNGVKMN